MKLRLASTILLFSALVAGHAAANPITVAHSELGGCDNLALGLSTLDELGDTPAFDPDERITAADTFTGAVACPSSDTGAANVLVTMTNLTGIVWVDVWYVSDPETSLSNVDGLIDGEEAFRIDAVGANTPLVFESGAADGIFEVGETWEFVIDDYVNTLGLGADAFFSPFAVGSFSPGAPSSGSVIAKCGGVDSDGDGIPNACDVCPAVVNPLQQVSQQAAFVGHGCACLCGDVNNSCTISAVDAQDIQVHILPNLGAQPGCYQLGNPDDGGLCGITLTPKREVRGCDANGGGTCSAVDAQIIQFALPALCPGCPFPTPNGYDPTNCAQF